MIRRRRWWRSLPSRHRHPQRVHFTLSLAPRHRLPATAQPGDSCRRAGRHHVNDQGLRQRLKQLCTNLANRFLAARVGAGDKSTYQPHPPADEGVARLALVALAMACATSKTDAELDARQELIASGLSGDGRNPAQVVAFAPSYRRLAGRSSPPELILDKGDKRKAEKSRPRRARAIHSQKIGVPCAPSVVSPTRWPRPADGTAPCVPGKPISSPSGSWTSYAARQTGYCATGRATGTTALC